MVGTALVQLLRERGFTNVIIPTSKRLDLRNQAQTNEFFETNKPEYVFHVAGHVGGIGGSVARPVEFLYENEIMALNVIHAAKVNSATKLMFLGSSCVYPRLCPQPMKEEYILTGPLEPTNEGYALAKISGMRLCEYMNQQYGTNFMSLMPCNLYGFKDHFEAENSHVISALIFKMHEARTKNLNHVEIWGTGAPRREFLFADDLADAMVYFMEKYDAKDVSPFVNVGSGTDTTIKGLAELIREVVGFKGDLKFNTSKPDGIPQKLMDVSRAKKMGWSAKTDLITGIRSVYDSYITALKAK